MVRTSIQSGARQPRALLTTADDDLILALHAAGASNEDVALCLAGRAIRLRGKASGALARRKACAAPKR